MTGFAMPPAAACVDWDLADAELVPHFQPFASEKLSSWESDRPSAVLPLRSAVTQRIYQLKPSDVAPFLKPPMKEWPFPESAGKSGWALAEVENLTGGLPLALGFHRYVEAYGHIPSWTQTTDWFTRTEQASIFYRPAWDFRAGLPERARKDTRRWQKAISWRIGNAYLSFIREMDFLSRMTHDHGIPLRMQILVDAVLKIDFWCGRHAVCAYIENDMKERKASPIPSSTGLVGLVHSVSMGDRRTWIEEKGIKRKLAWNEIKQAPDSELERVAQAIREDRPSQPAEPSAPASGASKPRSRGFVPIPPRAQPPLRPASIS